jgi:Tol biopolymer transport system component
MTNRVWLADGRFAYTVETTGGVVVYALPLDLEQDAEVTPWFTLLREDYEAEFADYYLSAGSLSPDGRYYAFLTSPRMREQLQAPDLNEYWVYVMNVDTGDMRVAGRYEQGYGNIAWSSDSTRFVFSGRTGAITVVNVHNLPGSRGAHGGWSAEVIPDSIESLTWSPNHGWIAYVAIVPTARAGTFRYELRVKNTVDDRDVLLYETRNRLGRPAWSPDGSQIIIPESDSDSVTSFILVTLDPVEIQTIAEYTSAHGLTWSPDGNWLVFGHHDRAANSRLLSVMRPDGSDFFTLVDAGEDGRFSDIQWRRALAESLEGNLQVGDFVQVYVLDDGLSLRSSPSISGALLERMPAGTRLQIIGEPQAADGYRWWEVQTDEGQVGWSVEAADGITTLRRISPDAPTEWAVPPEPLAIHCER